MAKDDAMTPPDIATWEGILQLDRFSPVTCSPLENGKSAQKYLRRPKMSRRAIIRATILISGAVCIAGLFVFWQNSIDENFSATKNSPAMAQRPKVVQQLGGHIPKEISLPAVPAVSKFPCYETVAPSPFPELEESATRKNHSTTPAAASKRASKSEKTPEHALPSSDNSAQNTKKEAPISTASANGFLPQPQKEPAIRVRRVAAPIDVSQSLGKDAINEKEGVQ